MTHPTAAAYGLNEAQLQQIIQATNDSLTAMHRLTSGVSSQGQMIAQANQSQSGQILSQKVANWTADFNKVGTDLDSLNKNVLALRDTGIGPAGHCDLRPCSGKISYCILPWANEQIGRNARV